jgi:serine phosphatase RsbU (regulator of sigma subunit)
VPKRIPDYLRLHTEDPVEPFDVNDEFDVDLQLLANAMAAATGWPVRKNKLAKAAQSVRRLELDNTSTDTTARPMTSQAADGLVQATNRIVEQLQLALHALREREAELAAGVPITPRGDEQEHLAERLEAILRGGAQAVQCHAAALYMLDDATTHLKLRASWGLPTGRMLDPPRPLRGSVADLEALVGHAVVLEDTRLLPHWKTPEAFPSAVCLPVSSPTTPLGTLWIFSSVAREFTERQTELLEIVAGRIASELEREMLLVHGLAANEVTGQMSRITRREQQRLPSFAPLLERWDIAGWATPSETVGNDFYDWGVLCDGRPFVALGGAEGTMFDAALTTAALHASLKSHTLHPHDARQLMQHVNETLWSASAGDQFASLFYAILEPEDANVEFTFAGRVQAIVVGSRGIRPLTRPAALLGLSADTPFTIQRERIREDEILVVIGGNLMRLRDHEGNCIREETLAAPIQGLTSSTASEIIDCLRVAVQNRIAPEQNVHATFLVARRKRNSIWCRIRTSLYPARTNLTHNATSARFTTAKIKNTSNPPICPARV